MLPNRQVASAVRPGSHRLRTKYVASWDVWEIPSCIASGQGGSLRAKVDIKSAPHFSTGVDVCILELDAMRGCKGYIGMLSAEDITVRWHSKFDSFCPLAGERRLSFEGPCWHRNGTLPSLRCTPVSCVARIININNYVVVNCSLAVFAALQTLW